MRSCCVKFCLPQESLLRSFETSVLACLTKQGGTALGSCIYNKSKNDQSTSRPASRTATQPACLLTGLPTYLGRDASLLLIYLPICLIVCLSASLPTCYGKRIPSPMSPISMFSRCDFFWHDRLWGNLFRGTLLL